MSIKTLNSTISDCSMEQQVRILATLSDFMVNVGLAKATPDLKYQQKILEYDKRLDMPGISFMDILAAYLKLD